MPPLNGTNLGLKPSVETTAFRALDRVFRQDKVLSRVLGKNFFSYTGDAKDNALPTKGLGTLPWMRVQGMGAPANWENEGQQRCPMIVSIELACDGTDQDQIMNLWGAVREAIWPPDEEEGEAICCKLQQAGVTNYRIIAPAYSFPTTTDQSGAAVQIMMARGAIGLTLLINT